MRIYAGALCAACALLLGCAAASLSCTANASIRERDVLNRTVLHVCAQLGKTAEASALIQRGASINALDVRGATPLLWAVRSAAKEREEMVKLLLKHGGDSNLPNDEKRTPLHWAAASWNGAQIVVLLLDNGAATTIDSTDINGDTPLHFAAINGKDEAAELLAARGANIEIRGGEHHSDCYQITAESCAILLRYVSTAHRMYVGWQAFKASRPVLHSESPSECAGVGVRMLGTVVSPTGVWIVLGLLVVSLVIALAITRMRRAQMSKAPQNKAKKQGFVELSRSDKDDRVEIDLDET